MLGEQPIADVTDARARFGLGGRIHGDVAFRVHAHRPPGEVCRANPHERVVHDHHFRVNERQHVLRA
jgi:hypothetical protein